MAFLFMRDVVQLPLFFLYSLTALSDYSLSSGLCLGSLRHPKAVHVVDDDKEFHFASPPKKSRMGTSICPNSSF